MKPLFIWAVLCYDSKKGNTYVMSSFQEENDAIAEREWQIKHAARGEIYYVTAVRLYRPNENVLP